MPVKKYRSKNFLELIFSLKKPVIVEAVQFKGDIESLKEVSNFMNGYVIDYTDPDNPVVKIDTLEGTLNAQVGDYIVKGINGEFYPVKPDIFEATYEEVK